MQFVCWGCSLCLFIDVRFLLILFTILRCIQCQTTPAVCRTSDISRQSVNHKHSSRSLVCSTSNMYAWRSSSSTITELRGILPPTDPSLFNRPDVFSVFSRAKENPYFSILVLLNNLWYIGHLISHQIATWGISEIWIKNRSPVWNIRDLDQEKILQCDFYFSLSYLDVVSRRNSPENENEGKIGHNWQRNPSVSSNIILLALSVP